MTTKNAKNSKKPLAAIASSGWLAGLGIPQGPCETLRQKMQDTRVRIAILESQLGLMQMKYRFYEKHLASLQTDVPANDQAEPRPDKTPKL